MIIVLNLDPLNGLDVKCANIQNAYLNANTKDKVLLYAGEEFGRDKGHFVIEIRALYGLKGAGLLWESAIHQFMKDLGFKTFRADVNFWMRTAVDKSVQGKTDTKANVRTRLEFVIKSLVGASVPREELSVGEIYRKYVLIYEDDLLVAYRRSKAIVIKIIGTHDF